MLLDQGKCGTMKDEKINDNGGPFVCLGVVFSCLESDLIGLKGSPLPRLTAVVLVRKLPFQAHMGSKSMRSTPSFWSSGFRI